MSDRSNIDWCDASIQPTGWGCYGPGGIASKPNRCSYCYAYRISQRKLRKCPLCQQFVPHWHEEEMDKPMHWKKPRRIFVQSMGDLFGHSVPRIVANRLIGLCDNAAQHQYLVLTKEAKIMYERLAYWPSLPANLSVGVSVTNQDDADERLPWLLRTDAVVRFLSLEPLLGEIDLTNLHYKGVLRDVTPGEDLPFDVHINALTGKGFDGWDVVEANGKVDWVIVGGMTGPGATKPRREWVEAIVRQCQAAGVPIFMKRNLSVVWGEELIQEMPEEMPS